MRGSMIIGDDAIVDEVDPHDAIGLGEDRGAAGGIAKMPVEGEIGVESSGQTSGAAGCERGVDIGDGGQALVSDVDPLGGVARLQPRSPR